ncbi:MULTISPECIES: cbb3-type cytochrome c oxidase subunit 3 [Rhodomicrobium]|uniref:cbb3-type cytochrome c oxidase subunit 3 n=1 Tax=Rhodomicrobium TaxID=1068 RepID=UPI000B4C10E7|nr:MULTISPECIES: cbb3-type cytochrome c oxidase subunit 3 [Rhodomicrobium]
MAYEDVKTYAAMAGLLIFIALFVGVLIYAFWPGNKARFEEARNIPLEQDPEDPAPRGDNGR